MQRVSSAVAASGFCIGSAAKAAKRSGRLRTSAASTSLACLAMAIAVVTSWIACTAGAFSDRIIISMPCLSISPRRVSCTSSRRGPRSFHTCAPNNCESASVASMATCSSSAILPCISFLPRLFRHHAMPRRSLSATPCCDEKQKSRPGGRLAEPELAKRAKAGGARRDRTADLVNAIHALSHLSYGPNSQFFLPLLGNARGRAAASGLLFLLDRLADDVGHIGIAFFLFFDEGGIVEALVDLDLFAFGGRCRAFRRWLLALLFGLGVFERDEFGIRSEEHDDLGLRRGCGPRDRRRRLG